MKLVLKLALLAFPAVALAQPGPPPSVKNVAADPTGNACSNGAPIEWYAGTYYGCDNTGHYAALGGGGTGTVNSGELGQFAYYPATGTAVSGSGSIYFSGFDLNILSEADPTSSITLVSTGNITEIAADSFTLGGASGLTLETQVGGTGSILLDQNGTGPIEINAPNGNVFNYVNPDLSISTSNDNSGVVDGQITIDGATGLILETDPTPLTAPSSIVIGQASTEASSGITIENDGGGGTIITDAGAGIQLNGLVQMPAITGFGTKGPVCVDTAGALYVGNNSGVGAPCP